ncbi:YybH family protein [Haloferula chungangensis]|uniref:YybH family protein n=1 Tax=Haloferula chungangensis TaxID=1048331 RepID=A0ABW2L5E9_9BACT
MNTPIKAFLAVALLTSSIKAEEDTPSISALAEAASQFVIAYNEKDASAIAQLFTEDGEMSDLTGQDLTSGREAIKARYEALFSNENSPGIAIEVDSVRLVAPNLAIEDGTAHITPLEEGAPPRSIKYTATLLKNDSGVWEIASTRDLSDVTDAEGELFALSKVLNGDWTCQVGDVRFDLAIQWEDTGKFLVGEMLTTAPDSEPQTGSIRIGWNAARKSITSWMFDSLGGSMQNFWTATDEGWLIRTEGTTAEGEAVTSSQTLVPENDDILVWSVTNKIIDGVKQPDTKIRLVRRPPEPAND